MTNVRCHCGLVQVQISGEPVAQFYCHCDHCQQAHGAAYLPVSMYRADHVKVMSGDPTMWKLHATPRATCRVCGTRVFAEPPGLGMRAVMAQLLPEGAFEPKFHVQCRHARLPVKDALPHFKGFPAAFGGSDDRVDW